MDIYRTSFSLFKELVRKSEFMLKPLAAELRKAHITVPAEQWAAFVYLVSFATFAISFPLAVVVLALLGAGMISFVFALLIAILFGLGGGAISFYYPQMLAEERKKKIDNALSFGTLYMTTLAKAGFPPQNIFKLLAQFEEHGELSRETGKISNDIEALGLDVPTAITRAMGRSPSSEWTEMLAGLKTTITVGGDLGTYLDEKAEGFVAAYKRKLEQFSAFLTMLIEIYITLVIVGAVFFMVITSIMTSIGAVPIYLVKALNMLIIFVGVPVLTAAFIVIAKGASPLED